MPRDHDRNCSSSWTTSVPDLCELEMEATGSNSIEVEVKECPSPEKTVLRRHGSRVAAVLVSGVCAAHWRVASLLGRINWSLYIYIFCKFTLLGSPFPSRCALLQERPTHNKLTNSRRSDEY
jgi:hypothetical protein